MASPARGRSSRTRTRGAGRWPAKRIERHSASLSLGATSDTLGGQLVASHTRPQNTLGTARVGGEIDQAAALSSGQSPVLTRS